MDVGQVIPRSSPGTAQSLTGTKLLAARLTWLALVVFGLAVFIAAIPSRLSQLRSISFANFGGVLRLGWSVDTLGRYMLILDVATALVFTSIAGVILARIRTTKGTSADNRMSFFVSLMLVMAGIALTRPPDSLDAVQEAWRIPLLLAIALGTALTIVFLHIFPDGRVHPTWMRWFLHLWILGTLAWNLIPIASSEPLPWPPTPVPPLFSLAWVLSGVSVQIYRFRRISNASQRQQTKWVIYGSLLAATGFLGFLFFPLIFPAVTQPGFPRLMYIVIGVPSLYLSLLALPISIAFSITRYRLWDIDTIINRTLVYTVLTLGLALVYTGGILITQEIFFIPSLRASYVLVVLTTLATAALFNPLRRSVQDFIDRRFYRQKFDATQTLAAFSATLRDDLDLETLSQRLMKVLAETIHPTQVTLYLRDSTEFSPQSESSGEAPERHSPLAPSEPPVTLEDPIISTLREARGVVEVDELQLGSPALSAMHASNVVLILPIVNRGELIGWINLGPRRSEQEYSADDRFLLNNLAAQAGPALRVAQWVIEREEEAQTRERLNQELRIARVIQETLLPKEVPQLPGWQMAVYWKPALAVGGDFYDFLPMSDGRLALVIADVTDKGVPAALVMATTRATLRGAARRTLDPCDALLRSNELLHPELPLNMFITCLYAILDPQSGKLVFANAGHNPPYHCHAGEISELRATGMPLGLMEKVEYEQREITINHGECLLLYSDGLTEAHNPNGEMLGFQRVKDLMRKHAGAGAAMIHHLLEELESFTGPGWTQEDDVTLMTLSRSG